LDFLGEAQRKKMSGKSQHWEEISLDPKPHQDHQGTQIQNIAA
jgi:hypothetical protein